MKDFYECVIVRLLGSDGLPKLCTLLKKMRIPRNGGEMVHRETLDRLIDTYYLWAHELHPRSTFPEFINSVSKLCREKAMRESCYKLMESEYSIKIGSKKDDTGPLIPLEDTTQKAEFCLSEDSESDVLPHRKRRAAEEPCSDD